MKDVRYDNASSVYFEPSSGLVATACSLSVVKPDGGQFSAPSTTLPSASTTVAAGSTTLALSVASASGFAVGEKIRLDSQGTIQTPKIARIAGSVLHLSAGLSHAPEVGDAVRSIRITASLPAFGESNLGTDYRLEWNASDGSHSEFSGQLLNVVRWPFVCPVSSEDVSAILSENFEDRRSDEFTDRIVQRVLEKLQNKIASTGRRAHLYVDAKRFREPGLTAIRLLLAEKGYIPATASAAEGIRALRFEFDDLCSEVIKSLASPYDKNEDGAFSGEERKQSFRRVRVER